jgi:Ger(x)C family germination protein
VGNHRRSRRLLPVALACLLSTGCWDKVEIENRGFIISLGIDKYDSNKKSSRAEEEYNRYTVSAALPSVTDMKESAVSDKSKDVKSADNSTISGCIQLMDAASSQKLYLGQVKLLVLGKGLLSDENLFRQAVDAMERDRDISRKLFLLSTKERAEDILRLNIPGEPMLGLFVENYYKNSGGAGFYGFYKVLEKSISDLRSTGCTLIPEIEAEETDKAEGIRFGGCAVIKDCKLAGWLDDPETRGYAWVMGNCRNSSVTVVYNNMYIPIKVLKSRPRITFSLKNGKLECLIRVNVSGAVKEYDFTAAGLNNPSNLKAYQTAFEQAVSKEIGQTADRVQSEINADIYNFKDLLRKKNYQLFLTYGEDWERHYCEMEIIPQVKVDIISIGTIK